MAMAAASILLRMMVSLEALLLLLVVGAGTSAAAVSGGTIRLPSDAARAPAGVAVADLVRAMARAKLGDEKRPWECCDLAVCTRSYPPICRCLDEVERCSDACKDCEATEGSRHVCADRYWGDPGPMCHDDHEHGHGNGRGGAGGLADDDARQAAAAVVVAGGRKDDDDDEKKRPWECCDLGICTLSYPPMCRCLDKVDRCSDACKACETEGSQHVCADWYQGDPAPKCHGGEYGNGHGGLAGAGKAAAAAAVNAMANGRKAAGGGDDDEKRPWKCCDMPICTKSWPPICFCTDTVERCASTCEHCEQVELEEGSAGSRSGGPRYRCLDPHRGDPGPSCGGDRGWARRLAARSGHRF